MESKHDRKKSPESDLERLLAENHPSRFDIRNLQQMSKDENLPEALRERAAAGARKAAQRLLHRAQDEGSLKTLAWNMELSKAIRTNAGLKIVALLEADYRMHRLALIAKGKRYSPKVRQKAEAALRRRDPAMQEHLSESTVGALCSALISRPFGEGKDEGFVTSVMEKAKGAGRAQFLLSIAKDDRFGESVRAVAGECALDIFSKARKFICLERMARDPRLDERLRAKALRKLESCKQTKGPGIESIEDRTVLMKIARDATYSERIRDEAGAKGLSLYASAGRMDLIGQISGDERLPQGTRKIAAELSVACMQASARILTADAEMRAKYNAFAARAPGGPERPGPRNKAQA